MSNFIHVLKGLSKGGVNQLYASVGIAAVWRRNEIGYLLLLLALSGGFKDPFLRVVALIFLDHTKIRHDAASKRLSILLSYTVRQWGTDYCNKRGELW